MAKRTPTDNLTETIKAMRRVSRQSARHGRRTTTQRHRDKRRQPRSTARRRAKEDEETP